MFALLLLSLNCLFIRLNYIKGVDYTFVSDSLRCVSANYWPHRIWQRCHKNEKDDAGSHLLVL